MNGLSAIFILRFSVALAQAFVAIQKAGGGGSSFASLSTIASVVYFFPEWVLPISSISCFVVVRFKWVEPLKLMNLLNHRSLHPIHIVS